MNRKSPRPRSARRSLYLASFLLSLIAFFSPPAAADLTDKWVTCYRLVEQAPRDPGGAYCFYQKARNTGAWIEAEHNLRKLIQDHPENPELFLNLAHVVGNQRDRGSEAESHYLRALQLFRHEDHLGGEVRTRDALWWAYRELGLPDKAENEVDALLELRKQTQNPEILARIDIVHARHLFDPRHEFSLARRALEPHEDYLSQNGPYLLHYRLLFALGRIYIELGMPTRSRSYFLKAARLAQAQGRSPALALGNALIALHNELDYTSDLSQRETALQLAEEALQEARKSGALITELEALFLIATLRRDDAEPLLVECLERAKGDLGDPDILGIYRVCWLALAEQVAKREPQRALDMVKNLWERIPENPDILERVYNQHAEMRVLWEAGEFDQAWEATIAVLDAIESVREVQLEREGRAKSLSAWSMTYPWLVGRILRQADPRDSEALQKAFLVTERMRARLLLDVLDTMEVQRNRSPELEEKLQDRLALVGERNQLQRKLRILNLSEAERTRIQSRVEEIFFEEQRLQTEISVLSGRFANLDRPIFASLGEVQASLAPTEALLSFHLAPWETAVEEFAGGSWLLVITRSEANAYPLPDDSEIVGRVHMLAEMLEKGTQSAMATSLSVRVYKDLLQDGLDDLPEEVSDLILIPDKALHRLSLATLRPAIDEPPLADRFRFNRIPSATLWFQRWRQRGAPSNAPSPALVLADPGTEQEGRQDSSTKVASLMRGGDFLVADFFGTLPFARQEAWNVVRHLGPRTEIRIGSDASERYLKAQTLEEFEVVHVAAHAVANEERPELAGVILAPDLTPNEIPDQVVNDGLLQFNEIIDLRLGDRVVVLSTCHSARGQILRGEGVFDLARAFFEAGARAVVGSLWRLEDRATARFFDDFYRHLARGSSLSEALHLAQRDQIARGAPPSAWAGIVVIGDGSLVPFPDRNGRHHPGWVIAAALVLLTLAVVVAARRAG